MILRWIAYSVLAALVLVMLEAIRVYGPPALYLLSIVVIGELAARWIVDTVNKE